MEHLPDCSQWPDTTLDPSFSPFAPPKKGTLDGHVARNWFSTGHLSHAFFLETLQTEWEASEHSDRRRFSGEPHFGYTILVNQTAKHALPVAINEMSNALLRALRSRKGDPPIGHIQAAVEPFPILPDEERVRCCLCVFFL